MWRKYYVLWIGNTKHGKLARLSSKDGRLDFWVDVDNIEELKRTKRRVAVHTKYPAPEAVVMGKDGKIEKLCAISFLLKEDKGLRSRWRIISENIKLGADNFAHWYYNTSWSYAKKILVREVRREIETRFNMV